MKKIILIPFFFIVFVPLFGMEIPNSNNLLSVMDVDAKYLGMGGCMVAVPGEVTGYIWNSAAVSMISPGVTFFAGYAFNEADNWNDIYNISSFATTGHITSLALMDRKGGFAYNVLSTVDTTDTGYAYRFYLGEFLFSFNTMTTVNDAEAFNSPFFMGVNVSYLHSLVVLAHTPDTAVINYGNGINVDIGLMLFYTTFSVGVNIRSLYSHIWYSEFEDISFPMYVTAGISFYDKYRTYTFQVDYNDKFVYRAGMEKIFPKQLANEIKDPIDWFRNAFPILRLGVFTEDVTKEWHDYTFSVGLGLFQGNKRLDLSIRGNYNNIINKQFDYGFSIIWKM